MRSRQRLTSRPFRDQRSGADPACPRAACQAQGGQVAGPSGARMVRKEIKRDHGVLARLAEGRGTFSALVRIWVDRLLKALGRAAAMARSAGRGRTNFGSRHSCDVVRFAAVKAARSLGRGAEHRGPPAAPADRASAFSTSPQLGGLPLGLGCPLFALSDALPSLKHSVPTGPTIPSGLLILRLSP